MSKTVKEILEQATEGMLTEDSLNAIQEAFDQAVNEKITVHVEKALLEQDTEYTEKLEQLLEAIDADHSAKLERVIESIDKNHAQKLAAVVKKYNRQLNTEATQFKNDIVSKVSDYLDLYLEQIAPAEQIEEAVKNKKAIAVLEQLRTTLGVDLALSQDSIREAIVDGKKQIDEKKSTSSKLLKQNKMLKESLQRTKTELLLEKATIDLPEAKANYVKKILKDKAPEFIKENFDYTLKMFDKSEEQRLEELKEDADASRKTKKVDRPQRSEVIVENNQQDSNQNESQFSSHPILEQYMGELKKH